MPTDASSGGTAASGASRPASERASASRSGEPLYALRSEPRKNIVVVGPRAALAVTELEARGTLHVPVERAEAKLRYRSPAVPARVRPADGGFRLELEQPAYGVAPGQAAVLYDRDGTVVGCGTIVRPEPVETSSAVRPFVESTS